MADRVLSSGVARASIQRFSTIVNGPLVEQIDALDREGRQLSDPNNWDGRLAEQFRATWTQTNLRLVAARNSLEELRQQMSQINQNIMQAGGNS